MPRDLYSTRVDEALALAAASFRTTPRKSTTVPYLSHLLQVYVYVAEHGGDEDQTIAALLHDYLEDVDGATPRELEDRFGARVARMVDALSDTRERPKPPWEERKRAYLRRLRDEPAEVKLVSCADKLHNAESILRDFDAVGPAVFERFTATLAQTRWYYEQVVVALEHGWQPEHPLLQRLRRAVARLVSLPVADQG